MTDKIRTLTELQEESKRALVQQLGDLKRETLNALEKTDIDQQFIETVLDRTIAFTLTAVEENTIPFSKIELTDSESGRFGTGVVLDNLAEAYWATVSN